MFTFSNSNLPDTVTIPFNLSAPVAKLHSGQSLAPLLTVKAFHKYSGVSPQLTEITTPDETYTLYKTDIPFSSVLNVKIDNYFQANNVDRLTNQKLYLEDSTLYLVANTPPTSCEVKVEIIAPIPQALCELLVSVPVGMSIYQVIYRGIPLSFGQVGQQLTIDCSDSCCKLIGGETLELTGDYSITPTPINQFYVFNIGQNVGLIDYVEWRGKHYYPYQGELRSGCFLWDNAAKSLKLIN